VKNLLKKLSFSHEATTMEHEIQNLSGAAHLGRNFNVIFFDYSRRGPDWPWRGFWWFFCR
jgi:hypothetical protein